MRVLPTPTPTPPDPLDSNMPSRPPQPAATGATLGDAPAFASASYAWYVVALFMLANVSASVDRQILTLLVEPIKRDLGISDTQVSLLYGLSFALFYTTLGLVVGRLTDTRNRRNLVAIGIAVWSVMTALCGLARNYAQLLAARIGVGVGEASLGPPSLSLVADYFPPRRLATATSVFGMGVFIGSGIAYFVGGAVIETLSAQGTLVWPVVGPLRPWQSVFLVVGLPGLLIALLMLTVREPARRGDAAPAAAPAPSVRDTLRYVLREPALLYLTSGYAVYVLVNYGTAAFLPAYFIRVHGWSPGEVGLFMGGGTMIFGTLGIISGGWLADRLRQGGVNGSRLLVGTVGAMGALASGVGLYLTRDDTAAKLLLIPLNIFHALPFGAAQAAAVELAPPRMRGQVVAIFQFALNTVGYTLGPYAVATFTDRVYRDPAAVGYSILSVAAIALPIAAALLTIGSRHSPRAVTGRLA
ncbi:MAG: spinster family MFS transporter [Gemmatimonadaceae bacterium]